MSTEGQPILRTEALTKIFRRSRAREVVALQNIELSIDDGRYVLFRGPSGSGKTTTLYASLNRINSSEKPSSMTGLAWRGSSIP